MNMWHLRDEDMVSLVFGDLTGARREACLAHLRVCPYCKAVYEHLGRTVELLEKKLMEPAPEFAWMRIKTRIERSCAKRDWSEPAWIPLILGNFAGIALAILAISLAGTWLENASVWHAIRTWPLARGVGPRSLAALVFWGAGSLVTLALAPVFWWESRRPQRRVVR